MFFSFQSVPHSGGRMGDSEDDGHELLPSSDCYATWSGPPTVATSGLTSEVDGARRNKNKSENKNKSVGFEKQNSVDQDMVINRFFSTAEISIFTQPSPVKAEL